MNYVPIGAERFFVEHTAGGELIRIPARKQFFAMLFLPVCIALWTAGGIAAIHSLLTGFQLFIAFWLCGWAIGWLAVASALLWMFAGSETISVVGGDLEIAHHALGFSRRWIYQGTRISSLRIANQPVWPFQNRWPIPFVRTAPNGSIKFNYGPRTMYIAADLDDGEAQMIVDKLGTYLPQALPR
ncbi:MAG TPA: hypothetical protein VL405_01265 [Sphingomonas sp.]|jgi:hypothetical protein|nr:hypothetical protein [Sphingomonas sp.]